MDNACQLTEAVIRRYAAPESYRRGEEYYQDGAVAGLLRRGNQIQAEVEGNQYAPYQVRITLSPDSVGASCSCPYDWGGWCKHIVAVALACIRGAEEVEERPEVEQMPAGLEAPQLRSLVLQLVEQQPELAEQVDIYVHGLNLPAAPAQEEAEPNLPRLSHAGHLPARRRAGRGAMGGGQG